MVERVFQHPAKSLPGPLSPLHSIGEEENRGAGALTMASGFPLGETVNTTVRKRVFRKFGREAWN
jgi:hypothetical protein